jgi:hypothetical protein
VREKPVRQIQVLPTSVTASTTLERNKHSRAHNTNVRSGLELVVSLAPVAAATAAALLALLTASTRMGRLVKETLLVRATGTGVLRTALSLTGRLARVAVVTLAQVVLRGVLRHGFASRLYRETWGRAGAGESYMSASVKRQGKRTAKGADPASR